MKRIVFYSLIFITQCLYSQQSNITFISENIKYKVIPYTKTASVIGSEKEIVGDLTIPSKVKYNNEEFTVVSIGEKAFAYSIPIKGSITLPNTLIEIEDNAFDDGGFTGNITIPKSVKIIGKSAFAGCRLTGTLSLPSDIIVEERAFAYCNFDKVIIPTTMKKIENEVFWNCSELKEIEFHDELTNIGEASFERCGKLERLIIPKSVKTIGLYAFSGCYSLSKIVCNTTIEPSMDKSAFSMGNIKRNLYIPNATNGFTASKWGSDVEIIYGATSVKESDYTFNINSYEKTIVLNNLQRGSNYYVFDISGNVVKSGVISNCIIEINIENSGSYIVKVGQSSKKIYVK